MYRGGTLDVTLGPRWEVNRYLYSYSTLPYSTLYTLCRVEYRVSRYEAREYTLPPPSVGRVAAAAAPHTVQGIRSLCQKEG